MYTFIPLRLAGHGGQDSRCVGRPVTVRDGISISGHFRHMHVTVDQRYSSFRTRGTGMSLVMTAAGASGEPE